MLTKEDCKAIAVTITNQIGRRKLYSLCAKNYLILCDNGVQFDIITRNGTRINRVIVKLTPMDEYDIEFWNVNMKSAKATLVKEVTGVYCEMLGEIIMSETKVEELILKGV